MEDEATTKKEKCKMEDEATTKKEKCKMKAKDASLYAKMLAVIILVTGHILMWIGVIPDATSTEICACSFSVMGIFSTVDINILADKFARK